MGKTIENNNILFILLQNLLYSAYLSPKLQKLQKADTAQSPNVSYGKPQSPASNLHALFPHC